MVGTSDILTAVLIAITAIYVWMTHNISKASRDSAEATINAANQMKDSHRPILVPKCNATASIAPWNYNATANFTHLRLHNVGPGVALSARIRLESGFENDPERAKVIDFITEDRTTTDAIEPGAQGLVRNHNAGVAQPIPSWSWLTIYYDDVYGRHFITRCQWNGNEWIYVTVDGTDEVFGYFNPKRPPALNMGL